MENKVLDERQAAQYVGLSVRTLQARRFESKAPPFLKLGRAVRYRLEDLEAFLSKHRVDPERVRGSSAADDATRVKTTKREA